MDEVGGHRCLRSSRAISASHTVNSLFLDKAVGVAVRGRQKRFPHILSTLFTPSRHDFRDQIALSA